MVLVKQKRQYWPNSDLSHNGLYPEKLSEVNGVVLIYARLIESRLWGFSWEKLTVSAKGNQKENLQAFFIHFHLATFFQTKCIAFLLVAQNKDPNLLCVKIVFTESKTQPNNPDAE